MNVFGGSQGAHVQNLSAYQVDGGFHLHAGQFITEDKSLFDLLQPIEDASHTRDRKQSPPDSACTRGTRLEVVKNVTTWTASDISEDDEPHILWMHGYVGCGKSAISQEVCRKSQLQGRPVASFFFFRNAGDRSRIWRLAPTLANQMAAGVPETAPLIRAAVTSNPSLKNFPVTSVARTSVSMQMQCLVYGPFKTAVERTPMGSLGGRPFLIVIDGLDECEDKEEVQDFIESMLAFFEENPSIPLRVFITSRVEQHIQSHLDVPGVRLENLVDHCSDDDIDTFLGVLFEDARRRDRVIRAYVRERGEWPIPSDKQKLVKHIGGSFIFAWSVFKFIMGSASQTGSPTTPMDRLPLALKMNPGLDGLYTQTLARSENLPHFLNIISTIALLRKPLPTSGIAELLGISTYEVVNVLVNLQAIIQVPGTDDIPVTLFHTSLRDFLTTKSRSGRFFAHSRHHASLFLCCLKLALALRQANPGSSIPRSVCSPAAIYAQEHSAIHFSQGGDLLTPTESDSAVRQCREALASDPSNPELIYPLAGITHGRAVLTGSLADLDKAVSLYREMLELQPSPHPGRSVSLTSLGSALLGRYERTRIMTDLEEVIYLSREALELRPSPHPGRSLPLNNLANALQARYQCTGTMADLKGAVSLHHEALELRPPPHPGRSSSLKGLSLSLHDMYKEARALPHLQEAIRCCEEVLASPDPGCHQCQSETLNRLVTLLQMRFDATGQTEDLVYITRLKTETSQSSNIYELTDHCTLRGAG